MKIAICDNSITDARTLADCCSDGEHTTEVFHSGAKLYDAICSGNRYDLIFLDVDMPDMNGIETGKAIRDSDPDVIIVFVTSYSQFALEAYECEAFNYLLKPATKEKITNVITRVNQKAKQIRHYHIIKTKGKSIRLNVSDIYYVECLRKHVIYHTNDRTHDTIGNISDAYRALCDYNFIQIHQGYIVNLEKIVDFDDKFVILDNGSKVEISVRKRKETLLKYAQYLERYI